MSAKHAPGARFRRGRGSRTGRSTTGSHALRDVSASGGHPMGQRRASASSSAGQRGSPEPRSGSEEDGSRGCPSPRSTSARRFPRNIQFSPTDGIFVAPISISFCAIQLWRARSLLRSPSMTSELPPDAPASTHSARDRFCAPRKSPVWMTRSKSRPSADGFARSSLPEQTQQVSVLDCTGLVTSRAPCGVPGDPPSFS